MVRSRISVATVAVAGAAWSVVAFLSATGLSARVELPVRDLILRRLPVRPATMAVAVVVDDASLRDLGPWPWDRPRLADLVGRIAAAQPRAIAVDILLPGSQAGDRSLAQALARVPAVLAAAPDLEGDAWVLPSPELARRAALAHATFELDHDGVMRRVVTTKQAGGLGLPAFALAALGAAGIARPVPVGGVLRPDFLAGPVPAISAARILAGEDLDRLRGTIVLVGVTALGVGDRVVTPTSRDPAPEPGVLVHATTLECLSSRGLLRHAPPALPASLAALVAVLAVQLRRLGGRRHVVAASLLLVAPAAFATASLALLRWELPIVSLTTVAAAAVLAVELRLFLSMHGGAATAARLLAADLGESPLPAAASPAERLATLERLAAELAHRRAGELESRRMVAHELKTPLTSVRGLTQLLAQFDLDPAEARRVASIAAAEAERLQQMVEGLLGLERIALRSFDEAAMPLDLGCLVAGRADVLATGSGRVLESTTEPGLVVRGDAELLGRVLDNLIGNAFKFSPAASPVRVRVARRGDSGVIEVSDCGPGIPDAERERIFQRFVRGAGGTSAPGLGLGLAFVAEVVTWHGGTVAVDSAEGVGSTFRIALPLVGDETGPEV